MKIEILVGSNYPDGKEEKRVEPGDVVDVPDKIAKTIDVKKNSAPTNVVSFVRTLAVPLAVINPPDWPPPIPSPPPSLF